MEHHTLPVISGLLLLTYAPLCYSVSLPTGQPQPNTFDYNCYYTFWAQSKTTFSWLYVSIKLQKIYVSKIVLNVLFIVEVFENRYCIVLYWH